MKKFLTFFLFTFFLHCIQAQAPQLVLPIGHTGNINDATFSPDGKYVVTASDDGTAKLWSAENAYLLRDLKGHSSIINSAKFSPDGQYIASVSQDNTVIIWETISGKLLNTLRGITKQNQSGNGGIWIYAGFSPDSKYILTMSDAELDKGKIRIWTTASGKLLRMVRVSTGLTEPWMATPTFSPDSKSIQVTSGNKIAFKYDIVSGKQTPILNNISIHDSANFSVDRKYFFTIERHDDLLSATIQLKEVQSGKTVSILQDTFHSIHATRYNTAIFSPDGKIILTWCSEHVAKIWDVLSGKLLYIFTCASIANFSPNGKMLVTGCSDGSSKIWEMASGRLLATLKGHISSIANISFSRDGKCILSHNLDTVLTAWDLSIGKPINNFTGKIYSINSQFKFWGGDGDKITTYWNDSISKTIRRKGALAAAYLDIAEISPDGKYVVTAQDEGAVWNTAFLWDAESGKLLRTLQGHINGLGVYAAHFSYDGRMVITAELDTARIWDTKSGKLLFKLDGHHTNVLTAEFSPDANYAIISCGDNSINLWDIKTKKLLYSFFNVDSSDYFGNVSSGYYQSSAGAAKLLHYVTPKAQVISFEQLDVKFNRPDKVLEAIGSTDTALINSYRKAYEKRIKKLGIDTTAFRSGYSVPEADFANRDKIEFEQKDGKLKLDIKSADSTYKLDRFNLWVNETPLYGQRGISIRKQNKNNFDSSITINLSQGENKIETSISNVNGTESYRMPLIVNYTPANKQTEKTYLIGIGIDQFVDSKYNLKYSTKDIRDLSKKLKEKYKDIIIDTLFNENVTISNVKALKQKLLQTTVNDKVIISYSGHGMLSKDFDYFLSTYAVNFEKPEENGLPYDELESLLDSIPARKKLMLIDACHSGEVDKDDLIALEATDKKLIKGLKPVAYKKEGHLGLKNSFELMQSLFVNVGKSTGAIIISAAAGTEFALEGIDNLPNGVFTYSILDAMNKYPTMKISELKKIVGERVVQLTNGLQKPTSRNETIAVDWKVW